MIQWLTNLQTEASLIIGLLFISLIIVSTLIWRLYKQHRAMQNKIFQLQNEVKAINSGNLGMGKKINQCAEEIAKVDLNGIINEKSLVNEKVYQQAGLLLERGATIEEVVEACEIAPAEAELLAIMKHSSGKGKVVV